MPSQTPWNNVQSPAAVANLTELAGSVFDVEGVPCRVLSNAQTWFSAFSLPSGMTANPNGSTGAIACASGFWVCGDQFAGTIFQTTWFIDDSAGNASNSGLTSAFPITETERQRRWGLEPVLIAGLTTVTYLSAPAVKVNYDATIADGAGLAIVGTKTTLATGTFTAVTVLNSGTQTPWSITDGALVGGFTPFIGKLIRITGGARAGAYARLIKDLGAGAARISPFGTFSAVTFGKTLVDVTPQVGDPYEVIDVTTLSLGNASFTMRTNNGVTPGAVNSNAITFDTVKLDGNFDQGGIQGLFIPIFAKQCLVNRITLASDFFLVAGGGFDGNFCDISGSFTQLHGAGVLASCLVSFGEMTIDGQTIFQNAPLTVTFGGLVFLGQASFFDRTVADSAVQVADNGQITPGISSAYGAAAMWGTNNTGHGMRVQGSGIVAYNVMPTVNGGLGAGRETLIGNVDVQYAAIAPNNIAPNGARFIQRV